LRWMIKAVYALFGTDVHVQTKLLKFSAHRLKSCLCAGLRRAIAVSVDVNDASIEVHLKRHFKPFQCNSRPLRLQI
jgi:hypothetical protein